jgi:predicted MFS family arabinose efflux permease
MPEINWLILLYGGAGGAVRALVGFMQANREDEEVFHFGKLFSTVLYAALTSFLAVQFLGFTSDALSVAIFGFVGAVTLDELIKAILQGDSFQKFFGKLTATKSK